MVEGIGYHVAGTGGAVVAEEVVLVVAVFGQVVDFEEEEEVVDIVWQELDLFWEEEQKMKRDSLHEISELPKDVVVLPFFPVVFWHVCKLPEQQQYHFVLFALQLSLHWDLCEKQVLEGTQKEQKVFGGM